MCRKPLTAAATAIFVLAAFPTNGQERIGSSDWLDKLDREHDQLVSRAGHVHARGQVQFIDIGPGAITLLIEEMQSPDKSIWMPSTQIIFHVTNRRLLKELQPGDTVAFEAARLRNAVMITKIRKVH